ncbi:MAG TPA: hypothetical protein VL283_02835 [Candidatus Baltobacteraceae bacterium]|nr:hypothetical protein [Candidatus Baltobacteraceae bacterium]
MADRLAKDVVAARDYYEAKSGRAVSRVIMCGGSTLMPGLVEHVSGKLSTLARTQRVEHADPWSGLELDPLLEKLNLRERGVLATTAVGLAMRGLGVRKFTDINLLPSGAQGRVPASARTAPGVLPAARASQGLRHLPTWLKLLIAVTGVMAIAVGAWVAASYFRPHAPSAPPAAEAPPAQIPIEAVAAVGPEFSVDPPVLPVTAVEVEAESRVTVERQGEETIGYAKGTIEIVNDSGNGQTLVATTRFLSEGGVTFRLDERAFVPARSRVTAAITADQPGPSGDVPAGRFTIPGLSPSTQRVIYGVTSAPTQGGLTVKGAPFTESDLATLRGLIEAEARESLETAAAAKAQEGMLLVADSLKIFDIRYIEVPTVGQPTGSFTAHAVVRAAVSSVGAADAETLLRKGLPPVSGGGTYAIGGIQAKLDASGVSEAIRLTAVAELDAAAL